MCGDYDCVTGRGRGTTAVRADWVWILDPPRIRGWQQRTPDAKPRVIHAAVRPRSLLAQALDGLLRAKEIVLERAEQFSQALRTFGASGADFADCLIERTAVAVGCGKTMTFDIGAAKFAGMALIT